MMSMDEKVAYVQKLFDENAKLNNENKEESATAFARKGRVWWRATHKVTGKIIEAPWRGAIEPPFNLRRNEMN